MRYATIVADPPWPYEDQPTGYQRNGGMSAFLPYGTMTTEEIGALSVSSLAAPAAHLYLWTTNRFLWDARAMLAAWGLASPQVLVWCKAPMGLGPGGAFANTAEFILFARWRIGGLIAKARETAGMGRAELHRALFDGGKPTGIVYRWESDDCLPSVEQWDAMRRLLPLDGDLVAPPKRTATSWWQWRRGEHSAKPEAFIDMVETTSPGPYLELFARRQRLGWDTWGDQALNHVTLTPASPGEDAHSSPQEPA